MRFTINREAFLKSLTLASKAVPAKSAYPVLVNLRLELNEKGLEVVGSNGDVVIRSTVPYMIGEKEIIRNTSYGCNLVNAKLIVETIRRLEAEEISVEVIDEAIMKIDTGKSNFKLNCLKADDYVDIDLASSGTNLEVGCVEFSNLIEQSAFAASNKEQRPILTALHLEAENNKLIATATDSARLARKEISIDSDVHFVANLPARIVLDVIHMFDAAKTVEISVSDKKALFSFDNVVISSRLIPGDYPVGKNIIPQNFSYTLEVNAGELLKAIDRVRILATGEAPVVKLSMKEDSVEVSARSDSTGSAIDAIETFQYNGNRLEVSFNSQFVLDAVKTLKTEDVVLCFLGEMKPFAIKNPKDDSVVDLITPMRTF